MADSDIRDETSPRPRGISAQPGSGETPPENEAEKGGDTAQTSDRRPQRTRGSGVPAAERARMLKEVRNINFPIGLRGYDRAAVDRYVEQVNGLIAELEISSSPESAVRHALDEVSEETREILQRAQATADEITMRSRMRADERLEATELEVQQLRETVSQEAEEVRSEINREVRELRQATERETAEQRDTAHREVAELREAANREVTQLRETAARETEELRSVAHRECEEARASARREAEATIAAARRDADERLATARREADDKLSTAEASAHELSRNAEAIWRERRRLIDDMRSVGEQLVAIGESEGKRFMHFDENGEAPAGNASERSAGETHIDEPRDRAAVKDHAASADETRPGDS